MLQRMNTILLFILGFGLPLHGALTVFLPTEIRWWKEVLLGLVLFLVLGAFWQARKNLVIPKLNVKTLTQSPALYACLFLVWGLFLSLINKDLHTALMAYRYLGLGFVAMLLGYALWKISLKSGKNGYKKGIQVFHNFCTGLVLGTVVSTLFGLWAKFASGYEVLSGWYSNTISSWVPGQSIPLYHEVGDFIRLQGTSSGPVEYAHLAVLALWYSLFFELQIANYKLSNKALFLSVKLAVITLLLVGIYQSGSRAALLGAFLLLIMAAGLALKGFFKWPTFRWTTDKFAALLLVLIVLTGMAKFTLSKAVLGDLKVMNKNIVRISDSDHFTRPIEALNKALEKPFLGNLGELGPAARAKNLAVNNNDQALIAESVPFDVAAQLGFIGLALWGLFFGFYYRMAATPLRALLLAFTPLMLLATIFDMTPLSISFFMILGLGLALPRVFLATPADHETVFTLKKLAFKRYTEAVWGWRENEQRKFVAQELAQGGIYLVEIEKETVGIYCLVEAEDHTNLFSFYIHPAYQSLGLGTTLLETTITVKALRLSVLKVNSSAKAFYDLNGFENAGEDEYHWHLQRII